MITNMVIVLSIFAFVMASVSFGLSLSAKSKANDAFDHSLLMEYKVNGLEKTIIKNDGTLPCPNCGNGMESIGIEFDGTYRGGYRLNALAPVATRKYQCKSCKLTINENKIVKGKGKK